MQHVTTSFSPTGGRKT